MAMTPNQWKVLLRVSVHFQSGSCYRAAGHGERVTLASLYRRGVLTRGVWRGVDGHPNAAYEYLPSPAWLSTLTP